MALQQSLSWFRRQAAPITIGLLASVIVMAFVWWFSAMRGMEWIAFTPDWKAKPWTLITYPWAVMPFGSGLTIICFLFLVMWVFMTGGSIERDLGAVKYLGLWAAMILLPPLFMALLGPLVSQIYGAGGLWLPEAAITIVWCARNPSSQIMLYGMVPLSGKWLGWATLVVTILISGFGNPILGVICALHLPIAYAYATNRIPFWTYTRGASFSSGKRNQAANLKKTERQDKGYFDDVKRREKDREERERLRKLFESSINEDKGADG
jgi:hypothetical protein